MSSLITSDQLSSAISKVKAFIESKFGTSANAKFGTVGVGSADIDYIDSEHSVIISGEPNGGTALIPLGRHGETAVVAMLDEDGNTSVNKLECDAITDGVEVYALPNSSPQTNGESVDPDTGGGTILTTRHRAFAKIVKETTGPSSTLLYPGTYQIIRGASGVGLSFADPASSPVVNEYWVDIEFPASALVAHNGLEVMSSNYTPSIYISGATCIYADGEPDWNNLRGKRIQLHIIHDIIHYVIIGTSSSGPNTNTEINTEG